MSSEVNCHTEVSYRTRGEIEHLISAFESCTLPRERWNHQAHLTVGLWYLVRYERGEATKLIRRNIQKYNRAHGIVTTKNSGYHETITLFFIRVVSKYLSGTSTNNSIVELLNGLIDSYGDKNLPLTYYSKERLMSCEARARWLEPDLKPLD
ncbi:MAG TPA: hypothetical protein VGN95_24165 [Pyrinomonadaceae bacterium]|jgi:hypothetical protein|nr:hypothetical protein [Pyrinomonadaceae bacterium]